jgi:hypothetical protein
LIFGTANPQDGAMAILHDDCYDDEIEKKLAQTELRNLLQVSFEVRQPLEPVPRVPRRSTRTSSAKKPCWWNSRTSPRSWSVPPS